MRGVKKNIMEVEKLKEVSKKILKKIQEYFCKKFLELLQILFEKKYQRRLENLFSKGTNAFMRLQRELSSL